MDIDKLLDADSTPFWTELSDGRLAMCLCGACGEQFFPPMPSCPRCGAADPALHVVAGTGSIYSWVVVRRSFDPEFAESVPFTILAVDIDGGGRVIGRLLDDVFDIPMAGRRVHFVPFAHDRRLLPGFALDA